jgi:dTDP-4-amino-4,6-dideoxygalactose transaminase
MKVDFYSTSGMPKSLKDDFQRIFREILDKDNLIDGASCSRFEEEFAGYLGRNHVVGVGNGFDAIKIGLQALGIGPGDKVAVPAHTFIATWYAVAALGAIPIGVDVTPDGQIDLDILEKQQGIRAVIPVHMHGSHCDMKRLTDWAHSLGIKVLEDCAQAAGLNIQGRKAGSWGDVGAFSFYPTKNLFALGDGGAIASDDATVIELARSISRYGSSLSDKYSHERDGQNSRLDSIHAGFLSHSLKHLDYWNSCRQEIALLYGLNFPDIFLQPKENFESVFHHAIIKLVNRDAIRVKLANQGVSTELHYPKVAGVEVEKVSGDKYPISKKLADSFLSLPVSPWQTQNETQLVISRLGDCLEKD